MLGVFMVVTVAVALKKRSDEDGLTGREACDVAYNLRR